MKRRLGGHMYACSLVSCIFVLVVTIVLGASSIEELLGLTLYQGNVL